MKVIVFIDNIACVFLNGNTYKGLGLFESNKGERAYLMGSK